MAHNGQLGLQVMQDLLTQLHGRSKAVTGATLVVDDTVVYIRRDLPCGEAPLSAMLDNPGART
jgi:hypothetical protein